ncbi:DnaJ domain-containing protein [Scenedesmus sp. NREL 46B-D3]|nr:DnaJ domain-containing protein [Scenedesmus sp. NREL 46B-D3]
MLHNPGQSCLLVITAVLLLANAAQCVQRDPYQVLGVRRSATQKEIIKAFRTMSRQYHPDKNPSKDATGKFQEISAAYDYLTDPSRQNKPWEWDFQMVPHLAGAGKDRTARTMPLTPSKAPTSLCLTSTQCGS